MLGAAVFRSAPSGYSLYDMYDDEVKSLAVQLQVGAGHTLRIASVGVTLSLEFLP
jgi:hypothetical protein